MSFGTYARQVRDTRQPYRWRVSRLRSCVQLYRPLGFHATLSFLEEIAGPFPRSEAALVPALDALSASRDHWHAAMREYATRRTAAKRQGQRSPHPTELNPNVARWWYGAPRRGSLHALRFWRRTRLPALLAAYPVPATHEIAACVVACLVTGGELTPDDRDRLRAAAGPLTRRLGPGLYYADPSEYFRVSELLFLAHHVRVAAAGDALPAG